MIGLLTGLLATLKGLPSAYDKDLQEDKAPVFQATDTLLAILPVLSGALKTIAVKAERMHKAIDPTMMATDLADYLVARNSHFGKRMPWWEKLSVQPERKNYRWRKCLSKRIRSSVRSKRMSIRSSIR